MRKKKKGCHVFVDKGGARYVQRLGQLGAGTTSVA